MTRGYPALCFTWESGSHVLSRAGSWWTVHTGHSRGRIELALPLPSWRESGAEVARCDDVEKTLRIVVTSGLVNRSRFTQGIRDSLTQPLQKVRRGAWLLHVVHCHTCLSRPLRAGVSIRK